MEHVQACPNGKARTSAIRSLPLIAISRRSMPRATPAQSGSPARNADNSRSSTGGATIVTTVRWFEDKILTARITPVLERITEGQRT